MLSTSPETPPPCRRVPGEAHARLRAEGSHRIPLIQRGFTKQGHSRCIISAALGYHADEALKYVYVASHKKRHVYTVLGIGPTFCTARRRSNSIDANLTTGRRHFHFGRTVVLERSTNSSPALQLVSGRRLRTGVQCDLLLEGYMQGDAPQTHQPTLEKAKQEDRN